MLTSRDSDHSLHLCSVLARCLTHAASAACPFQPICTTKPLHGNLFSSDLDKRHPFPLIFILSEYRFDHASSSPSSSPRIPPSVPHPPWAASPCFQSLSSLSRRQAFPDARFCICCPFQVSQTYASLGQSLDSSRHMSTWSSGDGVTQVLWRLGLVGSFPAPPGLRLKKIKGTAFGAHAAKGHHKRVWTWSPRREKVAKRPTYW